MWRRARRRPAAKSRFTYRCSRAAGQDSGRSPSRRAASPSNRVRRHTQAATRLRPRPAPRRLRSPSPDPSPSPNHRPNPPPPRRRSSNSLRPHLRAASPNRRRPIRGGPTAVPARPPSSHHASQPPESPPETPAMEAAAAAMPCGLSRRRDATAVAIPSAAMAATTVFFDRLHMRNIPPAGRPH